MARRKEHEEGGVDPQVQAANEIYKVAQEEANGKLQAMQDELEDIRQESFALGSIRALDSVTAYNELMKHVSLFRIKQHKEYRKGGLTWDGFCEALGMERRTVDNALNDIAPLMADFSEKVSVISNIPFNKIRHLGRQISGKISEIQDGALVYGDERIPLLPEYAEDVQALIDKINDEATEAKKNLAANERVLSDKNKLLNKMEKKLARRDQDLAERGLSDDEDTFLQQVENFKTAFDGYLLRIEPVYALGGFDSATPRMRAALISALHYMKMQILAAYDSAVTTYGDPAMNPELLEDFERWQQAALEQ